MNVYLIPGIGTDHRIFHQIYLPSFCIRECVRWIDPEPLEGLSDYAARLAKSIKTSEPHVLIGFSLGGIMATEIAKITAPVCTIIISSVPVSSQLPPHFRWANGVKIHRLIPPTLMKIAATCKHYLITNGWENKTIMRRVIWDGNNVFIRWAMNAVLNWSNQVRPENLYHIHGTRDEVFPLKYTVADYTIKGGHTLVMNQSAQVNKILHDILSKHKMRDR